MAKTRDFAQVIRRKLAGDPDLAAAVERESLNADVAAQIYQARKDAGLTQAQLAERAGTHQSVIARLEAADYDGHSLSMLRRIADALGRQLHVGFGLKKKEVGESVPLSRRKSSPKRKTPKSVKRQEK